MSGGLGAAAKQGPEALARYLAALPQDEWEGAWQSVDAMAVKTLPVSEDGYMAFARLMLYEPANGRIIEPAAHHMDWVRTIIQENRVLILAPPESAKTTIVSVLFLAYYIGKNPTLMNIVCSVSDPQAGDIAGAVATIIEFHPAWKLCFGEIIPDKRRGWGTDKGYYVKRAGDYSRWIQERGGKRKDPTLMSGGYMNRAIIGRRVDGMFVVDDMLDDQNSASEAELATAKSRFTKTISTRPTKDAKLIVIGTPWRVDDVYADIIATGLYKVFVTPAEKVDESGNIVSYWPDVWPLDRLAHRRKELTEVVYRLMYLMDLKATEGRILKPEWLQPRFPAEKVSRDWPMYYGIDFAATSADLGLVGRGKKRSYFSLTKVRAAPFGLIVVDGVRQQVSLAEAIEILKAHAAADKPRKIMVEVWGSGEIFRQQLLRETSLFPHPYRDTRDKTARFLAMARHFEVGRVRLTTAVTAFTQAFYDEWMSYDDGTNDTLDSTAMAIAAAGASLYTGDREDESAKEERERQAAQMRRSWMPDSRFAAGSLRRAR